MCIHPGYTESVLRADGIPLVIPMVSDPDFYPDMLSLCDGFLLTGSEADVFPELYGKTPPASNVSDHWRDTQDFVILEHAETWGKPVFGICRGCQVMNVFRGGTLALHFRDLKTTEINHDGEDASGPPLHQATLLAEANLSCLVDNAQWNVNSLHRQVCERLGNTLRVAAFSADGFIEAIEDSQTPERFFAVQWHPERSPHGPDALSVALFQQLVQQARLWRGKNQQVTP
jgi:putative glutamine amidotransferase